MLLAEISVLSEEMGYCYAGNPHFAEWLECSPQSVSKHIRQLKEMGAISITFENQTTGEGRKMYMKKEFYYGSDPLTSGLAEIQSIYNLKDIIMSGKPDEPETLPLEEKKKRDKVHPGAALEKKIEALREKLKTAAEPERAKIIKEGKSLKAQLETEKEIDAVILRLNEKAGFQYQLTTTEARKVIGKRLAENSIGEIFQVIDFKVKEWGGTERHQYLRPATLLNGHFEDYYQAAILKPKKKNENEAVYTPPVKRFAQ